MSYNNPVINPYHIACIKIIIIIACMVRINKHLKAFEVLERKELIESIYYHVLEFSKASPLQMVCWGERERERGKDRE
jgi:hypothetical protein